MRIPNQNQFPEAWLKGNDDIIDGHPINKSIRHDIYENYVLNEMKRTEPQYTSYLGLDIWLGTWNVNGKKVDEDISEWLSGGGAIHTDLFVIGLEEMVDLTASTVVSESQSQKRSQIWLDKIQGTLHKLYRSAEDTYYCVGSKILVGIFLCIFARVSLKNAIHNVAMDSVSTGLLGMMGNKGGVGIRMDINNSSICFICSHLAANREKVSERNSDYHRIYNEMEFTIPSLTHESEKLTIASHDIIYWLGDLNYRITSDVPNSVIFKLAKSDYSNLLAKDQLTVSQHAGFAFDSFKEPAITFPPTFKFHRGTNNYDEGNEKKVRTPAWCDRILYRINDTISSLHTKCITITDYDYIPSLISSDHKAVYQRALILIKKYDEEKKLSIKQQVQQLLNKGNQFTVPHICASQMEINFGDVNYKQTLHQVITLRNEGDCNAYFRFLPKDKENNVILPMFKIKPIFGIILPHQNVDISLELCIDSQSIHFVQDDNKIEELIAIRYDYDRDYYFHLYGRFLPTSFTRSLQELVRMKLPARENELIDMRSDPVRVIPYELWKMIDKLYKEGLMIPNLWKDISSNEEMTKIRTILDTGEELTNVNVLDVANVLIEWLRCLKEPVLDSSLLNDIDYLGIINASFIDTLLAMHKRENRNVFVYIMKFLQELLNYSQWNQINVDFLTSLFSRVFLGYQRDEEDSSNNEIVVEMLRFLLTDQKENDGIVVNDISDSE